MNAPANADPACIGVRWASALIDGLVDAGLERLVLSPGSRSTPLVLAAQRHPALELIPVLDERSAAFFALGLARASRRPVGVICTSGSAPAHWLPAVVEANASAVPLVLMSADRPARLRPWGANQTVDQTRLFGAFVLEFHDPGEPDDDPDSLKAMHALGARAAMVSSGRRSGPVHVNLSFPEPLVPSRDCAGRGEDDGPGPQQRTEAPWAGGGAPEGHARSMTRMLAARALTRRGLRIPSGGAPGGSTCRCLPTPSPASASAPPGGSGSPATTAFCATRRRPGACGPTG
jgi:2-succinyl-5-enolpyruvyl-6-hydroxy-3-cyclohexene-1-carboxylate synthase